MHDAAVIIPQYNQAELTLAAVDSLRRHHPSSVRIVVVDDGSSPEAPRRLWRDRPLRCDLVLQPHRGVTAAWNAGVRSIDSDLLVFLNNDVRTIGPWLEELLAPLRCGAAAATGPEFRRERAVPAALLARMPSATFLAGWCFAIRRRDFEALGGFDESLEMYFSDTDLQARLLRRNRDPRRGLLVCETGGIEHLGHRTTRTFSGRAEAWRRDRRRFLTLWRERTMHVEAGGESCGGNSSLGSGPDIDDEAASR